MKPHDSISVAQRLLLAASTLPQPFALNALVVAAWKASPAAFGLEGFEKSHPDNNKVIVALSGKSGIVAKGLLDRVRPKVYRLTESGRRHALTAQNGTPERIALPRMKESSETLLQSLLSSTAFSRYASGMTNTITFAWAKDFLEHDPVAVVAMARDVMGERDSVPVNGGFVTAVKLDQIERCARELRRIHERQLAKAGAA